MKKYYFALALLIFEISLLGQAPEAFKYQAIIRDNLGRAKSNVSITIKVEIIQGNINGSVVYSESNNLVTNSFGLINIDIGSQSLGDFDAIDWGRGPFFIKINVDGVEIGTTELLSVPYALYAKKSESTNEKDPIFSSSIANSINENDTTRWNAKSDFDGKYEHLSGAPSNVSEFINDAGYLTSDAKNQNITNLANPIDNKDAVNKYYVDSLRILNERDPIFSSSIANGINEKDTARWNAKSDFDGKYEHLSGTPTNVSDFINDAGYLTSIVADPINEKDAVNKKYVDSLLEIISDLQAKAGVSDVNGNFYRTIKIGNQIWMAENLRATSYINGEPLINGADTLGWRNLSSGAYCWYTLNWNIDSLKYKSYGALYNWYAVADGRNICPIGWHVPTRDEWKILELFLGNNTDAGGKLKEAGTEHWNSPNVGAVNRSGFNAIGSGYRGYTGYCHQIGNLANYWSATEVDSETAYYRELSYLTTYFLEYAYHKKDGFSVRCLKD